jgi:aryl-alcohol dehydrogenase-like predicted oxidoreductase
MEFVLGGFLKIRKLGRNGPDTSAIGLGCMSMTGLYGGADEAESRATIEAAADLGINHIDTANAYGNGKNEEFLGQALKGIRDKFILVTKFGNRRMPEGGFEINSRPESVIASCEESLQRLNTDVLDIFYQHRVDPYTPVEETVGAMSRLIEQGKVRYLGLSEAGPETIRRAHKVHPISVLQTEYSLWSRDAELDVLPICRELGISFVAYCPLGRGFLSGSIRGFDGLKETDRRRQEHPRFQKENLIRNQKLLEPLDEIAASKGATPAQIAIAWLLHQGDDIIPIPGMSRRTHLSENVAAIDIELSAEELSLLNSTFVSEVIAGTRYPEEQLPSLGL